MINPQLIEYVKQRRAQGIEDSLIQKELLLGGGWSPSDVEGVFVSLRQPSVPIKQEIGKKIAMKGISNLVIALSIIFLVGIPILWGLNLAGFLFGCALGGSNGFDCRIGLPAMVIGAVVGLGSGIKISLSLKRDKTFRTSKVTLIIFIVSLLGSYIIVSLPSVLSKDQRMRYLEGYSIESCTTGKPSVPWGNSHISTDSCYAYFDMCDSMQDSYSSKKNCLEKKTDATEYNNCKVFSSIPGDEAACMVQVATKKKDLEFCSTFLNKADHYLAPYLSRVRCAADVMGIDAVYARGGLKRTLDFTKPWATPLDTKIEKCNALGGISTDICLSYVTEINKVNLCAGISSAVPWLKQNCEDLFKALSAKLN